MRIFFFCLYAAEIQSSWDVLIYYGGPFNGFFFSTLLYDIFLAVILPLKIIA